MFRGRAAKRETKHPGLKQHWKFVRALCETGLQDGSACAELLRKLFSPEGRVLILACCKLIDMAEASRSVEKAESALFIYTAWLYNDRAGVGQTSLQRKGWWW